jgi:hypothetical protein
LRSRRVLRQDSGSIDRCERKAAGCADQHLAPGHSIAMLLRHFSNLRFACAGNGFGMTVS